MVQGRIFPFVPVVDELMDGPVDVMDALVDLAGIADVHVDDGAVELLRDPGAKVLVVLQKKRGDRMSLKADGRL